MENFSIALPPTAASFLSFFFLQNPQFHGKLLVTPVVAGAAIGYAPRTTYNKLSRGCFPIRTVNQDGREMVRVEDLLAYVGGMQHLISTKRKRGRPTKREQATRQEMSHEN